MVQFILSANSLSSSVFGVVYSTWIPFDWQYSSNCPWYCPLLSTWIASSFGQFLSLPCLELLEDEQHLVLGLQYGSPQLPTIVVNEGHKVFWTNMQLGVDITYVGMHEFQGHSLPCWGSCLESGSVLLVGQAVGALLQLHILYLWNEVIIAKSLHPLLTHMTQPVVP